MPSPVSGSQGAERPRSASPANANATTPTDVNEIRIPAVSAIPPKSGPRIAPAIAAPNANPSISPRCSFGTTLATHASAPAHVIVLEKPWTKRASPSVRALSASAKAMLEIPRRTSPPTTACFGL